jgi:hypothetical protein
MLNYIIFCVVLALVLIFLLYISKHTFENFSYVQDKKIWIEFMEIPTYIKYDLRKAPWNIILT